MTGTERRTKIVELIQNSEKPLSGTALAKQCDVSRQVIVQDIALIRASGYDIISTNRGYIIQEPLVRERVFKVNHTDEQLEEELYSIIDLGGTVVNVMVNHRVYGSGTSDQLPQKSRSIYGGYPERKIKSAEKYHFQLPLS